MASLEAVVRWFVLVAGLLGPGAAILRALRLPRSLAGAFAGSAVALHASVLGLATAGVTVRFTTLAASLLVVTVGALVIGSRRAPRPVPAPDPGDTFPTLFAGLGRGWPLYLVFWGIVIFRAVGQPLSGPDVDFRWSWLAEQILRTGTLEFYPPHRAADFAVYFWPESIPPGLAALYAWAYGCGGNFLAQWTTPVVLLQFLALHELLWRLGHRLGGLTAARAAVFACAACPLLNWSFFIGQETGLTTVALLGLVFAVFQAAETGVASWAFLAGLFAAVGASAREYGPVFPVFGAFALFAFPNSRRFVGRFLLTAAPLAVAWMARCLIRTGNPFYSLPIGSLFPTNEFFSEWRQFDRARTASPFTTLTGIFAVLRLFALFAPAALLGWLVLPASRDRRAQVALAGSLLFLALWLWSVPYTVGGLFYSQRVAAPAVALGAVAAGVLFSRLRAGPATLVSIGLLAVTLPQTLTLPENASRIPLREWAGLGQRHADEAAKSQQTSAIAAALNGRGRTIAADNAGHQARLAAHGITVVPLWSPAVAWVLNPALSPAEVREQWREHPVPYLLLAKFEPSLAFLRPHARWNSPPFLVRVAWEDPYAVLLEFDLAAP